jgi:hypothetical protein
VKFILVGAGMLVKEAASPNPHRDGATRDGAKTHRLPRAKSGPGV